MRKVVVSIILGLFSAFPHAGNANQIDLGSLLENMVDRVTIKAVLNQVVNNLIYAKHGE
ncbi:hypothetical protein ACFL3Q_07220 [Planctomycetota bacterium]